MRAETEHADGVPARQSAEPYVVVRDVTKVFRTRRGEHVALDNVSIDIGTREFVVLLGPSGCGKTTLLRCIAGLERPDRGEILIDGKVVFSAAKGIELPPEKRNLGMVFQSYALWPHMTVFENVAYPLRSGRRIGESDVRSRVGEALARIGLETYALSYPGQLSGGQQQRVALARAIVATRGLVLFDEPLSNLDAKVRERLRIELLALQRSIGFASLYVTHDQTEALALADRIAVMNVGRFAQMGSPNDIYRNPQSRYVAHFVGTANEIKGKLGSLAAGNCEVETAYGTIRGVAAPGVTDAGQPVAVVVRPEHCRFAAADGDNLISCTISRSMFLGAHVEHVVERAGLTLLVVTQGDDRVVAGSNVTVAFDPAHTRIFPAEA
jgi:iron(III) transport system ATP-binding protein